MDELKKLLGDELYAQVMEKAGDKAKIAIVSDGSYIPKEKFNLTNEELKSAKTQITDRDKQLKDLKAIAGDSEEMKAKIETLEAENKTVKETAEKERLADRKNFALQTHLAELAHNPSVLKRLIDIEKIELNEDGSIKAGIDDQIKALKASDEYLFKPETPATPATPAVKGTTPVVPVTPPGGTPPVSGAALFAQQANGKTALAQSAVPGATPAANPLASLWSSEQ